jgi:hypothetical protein
MKNILGTLGAVSVIWLFGLIIVIGMVINGYQGGDMMTEHYRSVLQFIFN